jgi:hypothetical protein
MKALAALILIAPVLLLAACDSAAPGPADTAASPVAQQLTIPDLTGSWFGRLGAVAPNMVVGDIAEQNHRRFLGTLSTSEDEFTIAGTISSAGVVSLAGIADGTSNTLTSLYRFVDFGDGAAVLLGTARTGGDPREDHFLLRQLAFDAATDPDPASVEGAWEGSLSSDFNGDQLGLDGSFEMGLNGAPSRFRGTLQLGGEPTVVEGSINGDGKVLIVAMGVGTSPGYFLTLEGLHTPEVQSGDDVIPPTPATIQGVYQIYRSLIDGCPIITPICLPRPEADLVDAGTFQIIAILIGL